MILICTSFLSLSKSALHLTSFTFTIATVYVTLVSVVTNIASDLVSAYLSHIDLWCLFLHFKQALAIGHSAALCLAPVQSKEDFLLLNIFLRSVTVSTVL